MPGAGTAAMSHLLQAAPFGVPVHPLYLLIVCLLLAAAISLGPCTPRHQVLAATKDLKPQAHPPPSALLTLS